jgi:nucleoside phosphorylase
MLIPTQVCAPFNGRLLSGGTLDPCFGIRWGGEVTDAWQPSAALVRQDMLTVPADLARLAVTVAQEWLDAQTALAVTAPDEPERVARVWVGTLASADTWTRDPQTIAWMRQRFGSLGEDMESVALAQIATRHAIPFLIARCLSNNDLIEVHTTARKRLIYPMMAERAALILAALARRLCAA